MAKSNIAIIWTSIIMLCCYSTVLYSNHERYSIIHGDNSYYTARSYSGDDGGGTLIIGIYGDEGYGYSTGQYVSRHDGVSFVSGRMQTNGNTSVYFSDAAPKSGHVVGGTVRTRAHRYDGPKISKYISYREATYSQTAEYRGIANDPTANQLGKLVNLGVNFFDKVREFFANPIYINSFFRSEDLNRVVGGATNSDHMALGHSAGIDIDMDGKYGPTNNDIFHYTKNHLSFYKLIAEFPSKGKIKWVHVSYSTATIKNTERNVYIAIIKNNRKIYIPYKGNEHLIL